MSEQRRTTPPASAVVGTVLGRYRITAELSTGGMGTVYRGVHELLGRPAAIKLLRAELTANAQIVERFFNEAKAATAIRHPGIVEVYDFGYTPDGAAYLVMELLDGESLATRVVRRRRLGEAEVVEIGRRIASALRAAHGQGIVHRDLKPDNIYLVPDPDAPTGERVKILDFGIAKLSDPDRPHYTMTGMLIGTPLYMAPEQARAAGAIDARADLYSLGCILYELLVGEPPFVGTAIGEIIAMQLLNTPTPPRARVHAVSPELDRVIVKLLAKEPEARYQRAEEVIAALRAPPATRPASAPSSLALIAGALTIALVGIAATWFLTRPGDAPPRAAPRAATPHADAGAPPPPPVDAQLEVAAPVPVPHTPTVRPRPRTSVRAPRAVAPAKLDVRPSMPTVGSNSPIFETLDAPKDRP